MLVSPVLSRDISRGADLARRGDQQAEALDTDIHSDTHACKAQVTLPHDALQRFAVGLR